MFRRACVLLICAACQDGDPVPLDATAPPLDASAPPGDAQVDAESAPPTQAPFAPRALETRRVWTPANARYVNEPTLIRAENGTWHVFSNGADGPGSPWVEHQLLHASAPSLLGPWTDLPDILTTRDEDATEGTLHAPFVLKDGPLYRIYYYDSTAPDNAGLHSATSFDLNSWRRDPQVSVGGRDPMILRTDGGDFLYTVGTQSEADGPHDIIRLHRGSALAGWQELAPALRNPEACEASCWGWYESPYVVQRNGGYFLFTTNTSSETATYERTWVLFSRDLTHFEPEPVATLKAHGGEIHEQDGALYITHGGWPEKLKDEAPGLYVTRLDW